MNQLELRKAINAKLVKLNRSKSTKNKAKLRILISSMKSEFKQRFGYGINYNWE